MPTYCFIKGCNNTRYISKSRPRSDENISFFSFPSKLQDRRKWMQIISTLNKQDVNDLSKWATVCQNHFKSSCFQRIGLSNLRLVPGSIPSIFPNLSEQSDSPEDGQNFSDVNAVGSNRSSDISTEDNIKNNGTNVQSIEHNPIAPTETDLRLSSATIRYKSEPTLGALRYRHKVTEETLKELSPGLLFEYITSLKNTINRKNAVINSLRRKESRQNKRITLLKALLEHSKKVAYNKPIIPQ